MTHSFRLSIYLDFIDFIDLYRKIHLYPYKNENWFHANSEFVDKCNWESKDQTVSYDVKKKFKKSYLLFKTWLKIFFWLQILAKFVGA